MANSELGLGNGSLKSEELNEGGICRDQLQIGDMWQDIQGANKWEGFLDPIHPLLKAEIPRYVILHSTATTHMIILGLLNTMGVASAPKAHSDRDWNL
ncbi:hypothetical protein SUGI_0894160 [Cryptomeria japonica]|nr:hypothetical protein SUGI_0894160 [Cryptomeria japonica]